MKKRVFERREGGFYEEKKGKKKEMLAEAETNEGGCYMAHFLNWPSISRPAASREKLVHALQEGWENCRVDRSFERIFFSTVSSSELVDESQK